MASRKITSTPTNEEILHTYKPVAIRLAKRLTSGDAYLRQVSDDIANQALLSLAHEMTRQEIRSPEAFMFWKMKNLKFDYLRQRNGEISRLIVWNEEAMAVRGKRLGDIVDTRRHWFNSRGLSTDFVEQEEEKMASLQALAMTEIMPDEQDREILRIRFYEIDKSISDIARQHGNRTPSAMANHLRKLLGDQDTPGALSSARDAVGELSLATATAFCKEITFLDGKSLVSDPIGAAIAHFEIAGSYSPAHQERAATGIAHLRWIQRNQPTQRGLPNKILNRLIRAACFYVVETNDARHDEYDDLGLHDDVNVVAAVQRAVRKYRN
jgi:DNA-directed RNA polymerase specialized sigma24 family protein